MDPDRAVGLSSSEVQSSDPLAAEVDGEAVPMIAEPGGCFGPDAIGGDVWNHMETPVRVSDLSAALAAGCDGAPAA